MPFGSELVDDWADDDWSAHGAGFEGDYVLVPAVRVENLWIRYRTTAESGASLRETLTAMRGRTKTARYVEALRGVTFDVPAGGVYGVIGHNGAGKSTLFRTVAGILAPTEGRVTVAGRVTPLLSLGVGFNRELTGRENILLGGLSAGLQPDEIMEHYDEVVGFADLGNALDYPMRTYSSGMFARLGFAVAAHLDPDIMLIDEALSAGDGRFKKRCMDKLVELCGRDCTVMIISHGLGLIKYLAERCVWLDQGEVVMEGHGDEVVDAYLNSDGMRADEEAAMEDF
jgi:ABC-type polysaccharide/polyol phosphate transport system ATPase subunit